ncbi:hypothetical protein CH362_18575 [Leptospira saintgironsiae]|uniref:Uncharacterized protein n=2 Tax=Leptospira saintgironsiae TaxID=2023183 RepID=A0A2M9Y7L8_9LEPT|nr:hypothetical protein CH362_18575 [Leptospira saintgironsiae]
MKINRLFFLILLFLCQCMLPDRDKQSIDFHPDTIRDEELNVIKVFKISDHDIKGKIILLKSNSPFVDHLLSNFVVDNTDSALIHLSQDYLVGLILIQNESDEPESFSLKNLNLQLDDKSLIPLKSTEYPKKIRCFNWKGTAKNFYNFIAISAITIYTINAMFACIEGKCEEMDYLKQEIDKNHPSKVGGSYFSDLNFVTTLNFNNKVESENIIIAPKAVSKGVVLYSNPFALENIKDYITKGNCTIE